MEKGKIVQVQVQDIGKNPFRQYSVYAIREDKVARLIESIHETGFWETVIGRYDPDPKKAGKVQIAFGHHRIAAAMEVYKKPGDTIPIIIRDLSDDQMRRMMIRENAEEYGCVPAAIDDAVSAARDFLEGHKEEVRKALKTERPGFKRVRVGASAIAKYTGYSQSAVELSLQRLGWIKAGEVDQEALYKMPYQEAARRFARAVLSAKLSVDEQKAAAEKIAKVGGYGVATIEQTILSFRPMVKPDDARSARFFETRLRKATRQINEVIGTLGKFCDLNQMTVLGDGPTDEDISEAAKVEFNRATELLAERIKMVGEKLDRNPEHGKAMFPGLLEEEQEPAPKKSAPSEPPNEALKAIQEKIEKAKARLKESAQKKQTGKDAS